MNTPQNPDQPAFPSAGRPRPIRRPMKELPYITFILIGSCVLAFLLQMVTTTPSGVDLLTAYGAKINSAILRGQYWRLITPMWLHGSILHIAFNMYALFAFGGSLEKFYGHRRFLALYLLSGFGGNVVSFLMSPNPSVGSSTAIFGLIAAQGVFIYHNRSFIRNSRSLLVNTVSIAAINLVLGLSPGIDNWGHLGGLLAGLAFAWSAGPVWEIEPGLNGLRLVNQRSTGRVVAVGVGVAVIFAAAAAAKIFL